MGEEDRKQGVTIRSIEELLTLTEMDSKSNMEKKEVKLSVYCFYDGKLIDLLAPDQNEDLQIKDIYEKGNSEIKIIGLTKFNIKKIEDYKEAYNSAIDNLDELGKSYEDSLVKANCHFIISFELATISANSEIIRNKLNFVRTADIDSELTGLSTNDKEIISIFTALQECIEGREKKKFQKKSKFELILKNIINENTKCIFVVCGSTQLNNFDETCQILEFGEDLYNLSEKPPMESVFTYKNSMSEEKKRSKENYSFLTQDPGFQSTRNLDRKICKDIDNLYKEIKFLESPKKEIWLNDKQYELFLLEKTFKKQQSQFTPTIKQHYDKLLSEIKNNLEQIEDEDQTREKINENLSRFSATKHTPKRRNLTENNELIDKYSKVKINYENSENAKEKYFGSENNNEIKSRQFELGIKNLRENIQEKILEIEKSETDRGINEKRIIKSLSNKNLFPLSPQKGFQTTESFNRLKQTIFQKDSLEKEKYNSLLYKYNEIKNLLDESLFNNTNLENRINENEQSLLRFEEENRDLRVILNKAEEKIRLLKGKEDSYLKNEEDLRDQILGGRARLEKKKKKIKNLKDKITDLEKENKENLERSTFEIENLQKNCEELQKRLFEESQKLNEYYNSFVKADEELKKKSDLAENLEKDLTRQIENVNDFKNRLEQETKRNSDIKTDYALINKRVEELNNQIRTAEGKTHKNKSRHEEEKNRIILETSKKIEKKKKKLAKFKEENAILNEKNKELARENTELKSGFENEEKRIKTLEIDNENLKKEFNSKENELKNCEGKLNVTETENGDLKYKIQIEIEQKNSLQGEAEKQRKLIKNLEKKLNSQDEQLQYDLKTINDLKGELNLLQEQNSEYKEYISKLESQLDYLEKQTSLEVGELEKKLTTISYELQEMREENENLLKNEAKFRKNLAEEENFSNKMKEKYLKMKFLNKTLKKQLLELENKLNDLVAEREMELKEMELSKQYTNKAINTKLRVLDDIQNMVKRFRITSKVNNDSAKKRK